MSPLPDHLAPLLSSYFLGRRDIFSVQKENGDYIPTRRELSDAVLLAHCKGQVTVSTYTTTSAGNSPVSMLDVDSKEPAARELIVFIQSWLAHFDIPCFVEASGKKGYHIWVVYKCFVPAKKAHRLLRLALEAWEEKNGPPPFGVEINPKQVQPTTLEEPGNCVKLPWGRHQVTKKRTAFLNGTFMPLPDWGLEALQQSRRITEMDLDTILAEFPPEQEKTKKSALAGGDFPRSEEFNEVAVQTLVENCSFIRHCRDHAVSLGRNQWWSMIQLLAPFGDAGARTSHEFSAAYPGYTERETDQYIQNAVKSLEKGVGPHTCAYINRDLGFGCPEGCEAKALDVASPTGMASRLASLQLVVRRTSSVSATRTKKGKYDIKVVCPQLAEEIMKDHIFKTFKDTEHVLVYHGGVYCPYGKATVKQAVQHRLLDLTNTYRVTEVLNYVRIATYTDRELFNPPNYILNLKNGLLDIQTGELKPHSPEFLSTVRMPIAYDPAADCPRIKRFWQQIVRETDIPILEEIFGYCLEPSYFIHRAFMLVGDGANGKSTLVELLRTFLGKENCSTIPLQAFDIDRNRFATSYLWGKLANLFADLPAAAMPHTGTFKQLCGGDTVPAERKYGGFYSFENRAKLIFSANRPPAIYKDDSYAFWRRWVLIDFPHQFKGDQADKRLLRKLTGELPGLLNVAVEGLKRLWAQGDFSYERSAEETSELYIKASRPIYAFLSECCDLGEDYWTTKEGLYNTYKAYAYQANLPVIGKESFGRALKNTPEASNVRATHRRIGGQQVWGWSGVQVRAEAEYSELSQDTEDEILF